MGAIVEQLSTFRRYQPTVQTHLYTRLKSSLLQSLVIVKSQEAIRRDRGEEVMWQQLVLKESELPAHTTSWHHPDLPELIFHDSSI